MDHSFRTCHLGVETDSVPRWADRPSDPGHPRRGEDGSGHGLPLVFGGTVGIFHPGWAPVAVLMLSPVGYEEMCCRATWRSFADAIAAAGIPCLRFDYPGTADALDSGVEADGIEDWRRAAIEAAAVLREAAGVERLILLGQGLGAALAAGIAADVGPLDAVAYLAPVTDGRRHLRELGMWGRMVKDRLGVADDDEAAGCSVAGFSLSPGRLQAIRALSLTASPAVPDVPALVVSRPGRASDTEFAAHLWKQGRSVTEFPYEGYDRLASDPIAAVPPSATLAKIVAWLKVRCGAPARPAPARLPVRAIEPATSLVGDGFSEHPLRFGPGLRLFGVLCRPTAPTTGRGVVFVEAGCEYHVGLGRITVQQARALAARGIASLRFDPGGIGDSPPSSADAADVLYSRGQIDDVRTAIDLMETSGFGSVSLLGRCSGAFAAFHAATHDDRVDRLVLVNLPRFVWHPDEDVAESLRYAHRGLGSFGSVLWRRNGIERLLTGRLRVVAAGRHLLRRWSVDAGQRLARLPLLGGSTRHARAWREVRRGLAALTRRGASVTLIYSAEDPGLIELRRRFRRLADGVDAVPGASVEVIADADHNFIGSEARARLFATAVAGLET